MGVTRWRGGDLLPAKPSPQGEAPCRAGACPRRKRGMRIWDGGWDKPRPCGGPPDETSENKN